MDLEKMRSVLERVQSTAILPEKQTNADAERLRGHIADSAETRRLLEALRSENRFCAAALLPVLNATQQRERLLRTEYYLLTGEQVAFPKGKSIPGVFGKLRALCLLTEREADKLHRSAENSERYRGRYSQCAALAEEDHRLCRILLDRAIMGR